MGENTEIEIDPSVLKGNSATYSSLTDINGADVFSNAFEEIVNQYKEESKKSYDTVQGEVFVKIKGNSMDIYDQVKNSMFSNSEIKVLKESSTTTAGEIGLAIPIIGITFVIAILIIIRYVDKKRRKWKNHDVDTYAYE